MLRQYVDNETDLRECYLQSAIFLTLLTIGVKLPLKPLSSFCFFKFRSSRIFLLSDTLIVSAAFKIYWIF